MSIPNADLIAVSLACLKDAKSPYSMYGASLQLSLVSRVQLRTLLEKVVDLSALQFWSNQTLAFLTFTDLQQTWSNCLRLSSSIFQGVLH